MKLIESSHESTDQNSDRDDFPLSFLKSSSQIEKGGEENAAAKKVAEVEYLVAELERHRFREVMGP